ncbi:MAG TPA: glycosyltransferase family A protein [Polyangia bacterium]|nr:glycosyltransferase family A protein [Polyangia bacterium]
MTVKGFSRRRISLRPRRGPAPIQASLQASVTSLSRRTASGPGAIWVCVPCMGRLSFLQKTVGSVISNPAANYCLVDYSCPDRSGDWLAERYAAEVRARRMVVERVTNQRLFHKCKAHNAGAYRALSEGAEYLCFLDADTVVAPGFFEWIRSHVSRRAFLIAGKRPDGSDQPSVTGLLVVHRDAFRQVGGFDESFRGWGGEDIEMRLRLFLLAGLDYVDVPLSLINPLSHADALRTQFYVENDIRASNRDNMRYLLRKVTVEWRGRCLRDLASAARLWYGARPAGLPAASLVERRPRQASYRRRPIGWMPGVPFGRQAGRAIGLTPTTASGPQRGTK